MYLHKFIYYKSTNFAVVNKMILHDVMVVYFENIGNIEKKSIGNSHQLQSTWQRS